MNKVIIQEHTLSQGDKVYYKGAEMIYERPVVVKEKIIPSKIYCSWENKHTGETEEGVFNLSELTLEPPNS